MPSHWTYETPLQDDDLHQGDILSPTADLREIFKEVHPHFSKDKYAGFLVATQSCDLVRRNGQPKSQYVNLAVVRHLSPSVVFKLICSVAEPATSKAFKQSAKSRASQLFERLLNQNEQAMGIFFLHSDTESGIDEHSVAFLRVTVALRAEHYGKLVQARAGRLRADFRAKLGWLIGNLYDRPATPDWSDFPEGKQKQTALAKLLQEDVQWLDDEVVAAALKKGLDLQAAKEDELKALKPSPPIEQAVDLVVIETPKVFAGATQNDLEKLRNRLLNNGKLRRLLAQ